MNRRSFLKSAALAVVAAPVVGLPDLPVAKAVPAKVTIYTVIAWKRKKDPLTKRFVTRYKDLAFDEAHKCERDGFQKVEIYAKAY